MDTMKRPGTDDVMNELLVKLFKNVVEIEDRCLITPEFKDISVNDMHIIEAVGMEEPKSMSTVAKLMSITTGTLTKLVDGLSEKGYVNRERGKKDKRVVLVSLTEKGKQAFAHHERFHRSMVRHMRDGLNEQETSILVYALAKLNDNFNRVYEG